ncbi:MULTISPECIES: hypothetical protein [Arthrobacter]|uniref:NAD(P)/FAD-dependent oxidoreductase n=2 Tax=Arthrobacter TaxID=1663 RepID=A0ABU9KHB7_9MICC|nr:hypothetical protein [Arthrobacter sp. YJM1]MDP5225753.1 hypothetical protein [Arthrobacter sp. YJM1]
MPTEVLDADYLIVGSGAVGLAFADVLFTETDATLAIVDRRHGPGGHWNDAYPFVRLHQPSAYYGVNSRDLGTDSLDRTALNKGMYERASSAEILAYYQRLMTDLMGSGRVRYFPMSEYVGDFAHEHRVVPRVGGDSTEISVRRRTVDTSYIRTEVPATHPPRYLIADGVRCVPPHRLPGEDRPEDGYVVIGSGKTGVDVCLWLLESGVAPERITWVAPRDSWFQNRHHMQPLGEFMTPALAGLVQQAEIAGSAQSADEFFLGMEAAGVLLRVDPSVTPEMFHGAILSVAELEELRRIPSVVRMGRVQAIGPERIVLEGGTVPSSTGRLYIDCTARGVDLRESRTVFTDSTVTPQMVRTFQPVFSSALIAHVEATVDGTEAKNALCRPMQMADRPAEYLRVLLLNYANHYAWNKNPLIAEWLQASRLDRYSRLTRDGADGDLERLALIERHGAAVKSAVANLPLLVAQHEAAEAASAPSENG